MSVQLASELQAKITRQIARRQTQLSFGDLPAQCIAQDRGNQSGNRRARLLSRQPPKDRRVIAPDTVHALDHGQVSNPARQALVGHSRLVQQRPQPQVVLPGPS